MNLSGRLTDALNIKIQRSLELNHVGIHPERVLKSRPYTFFRGDFLGIEEINGERYYHYVIPDLYNEGKEYIDLQIPVHYADKTKAVKMREVRAAPLKAPRSVYVGYISSFDPVMNPRYIEKDSSTVIETDYPCLLMFHLGGYGERAKLRIGQKTASAERAMVIVNGAAMREGAHAYRVCPITSGAEWSLDGTNAVTRENHVDAAGCELWYWSDTLKTEQAYRTGFKYFLEALPYIGYVFTVPLDILSSPIQIAYFNCQYR